MTPSEETVTTTPEPETITAQAVQLPPDGFGARPRIHRRTSLFVLVMALAALTFLLYSGIHSRVEAESRLKQRTEEAAIPTVAVVSPQEGAPLQEIVLPGDTQAFSDAPIYARTSRYLKRWYFDIGAHVQKGQLLAEIETPELDQQLQQARADLDTAQANLNIAKITADRWQDLVSTGSVSQQETDQAVSNLSAVKLRLNPVQPTCAVSSNCNRSKKSMHHLTGSSPPAIRTSERSSTQGPTHNRGNSFTWPPSARSASTSRFPRCIPVRHALVRPPL